MWGGMSHFASDIVWIRECQETRDHWMPGWHPLNPDPRGHTYYSYLSAARQPGVSMWADNTLPTKWKAYTSQRESGALFIISVTHTPKSITGAPTDQDLLEGYRSCI